MAPVVVLSLFTLVASVAAVSNVQPPASFTPNKEVTITWSSDDSDSTANLALYNVNSPDPVYVGGLVIANTVNLKDNSLTLVWPQTEPGTYKLTFVSPSDPSNELGSSNTFNVGAASPVRAASGSSSSATAPPRSSLSLSASSAASSLSAALTSGLSSIESQASSAASSLSSASRASVSASQSSVSASQSASATPGAASPVRLLAPGAGAAAVVLGGLLFGAVLV
ncbi:hypothetical protein MKEN_00630700 [Mycena kentingensis (nom. inval.)]|nr:hypothetical protein MKEN_00630700 [Mycena kentingensis (nom. inval.)]